MGKKVKVLQVVPLGAGGITSLVINLAENLDWNRVEFDYLTFFDRKEFNEDKALQYGGKKIVVPIDKYTNSLIRATHKFFDTIRVLKKEEIDIIHINASFPYDILIGVSAKLSGVKKVVFHSHNSNMDNRGALKNTIMKFFKVLIPIISDCNLACSQKAAEYMFPKSVINKGNYSIVNNGITCSKYVFSQQVRDEYRKKIGCGNNCVVGHIGRFTEQKNHKRILSIFEKILEMNTSAVLLLIGTGELEQDIKQEAEKRNLSRNVIFYGVTNEVPQLLQAMDVFLFPSLYEGLPVVGVEVQAAGLPIVMSDVITREVGITEYAKYIPLSASDEEWALAALESAKKQRSNTSSGIAEAGFDIKNVTNSLMCTYEELMTV